MVTRDIPLFRCPATPGGTRKVVNPPTNTGTAVGQVVGDYAPIELVETQFYTAHSLPAPPAAFRQGLMRANTMTRIADVLDGLSNTVAISECADRPKRMLGRNVMPDRSPSAASGCNPWSYTVPGAGWADHEGPITIHGANEADFVPNGSCMNTVTTGRVPPTGNMSLGKCIMNCTNWAEIYSYHEGGCNFLFGDGSVRFLSQTIASRPFAQLVTMRASDGAAQY